MKLRSSDALSFRAKVNTRNDVSKEITSPKKGIPRKNITKIRISNILKAKRGRRNLKKKFMKKQSIILKKAAVNKRQRIRRQEQNNCNKFSSADSITLHRKKRINYSNSFLSKNKKQKVTRVKYGRRGRPCQSRNKKVRKPRNIVVSSQTVNMDNSLTDVDHSKECIMKKKEELTEKQNKNVPLLNFRCVDPKTGETQFGIPLHNQFIPFLKPLVGESASQQLQQMNKIGTLDQSSPPKTNNEDEEYLKELVQMLNITNQEGSIIDTQNALPVDNNYFWI